MSGRKSRPGLTLSMSHQLSRLLTRLVTNSGRLRASEAPPLCRRSNSHMCVFRRSHQSCRSSDESKDDLKVSFPALPDSARTPSTRRLLKRLASSLLSVINTVVEPNGQTLASKASAPSGIRPSRASSTRDFRTVHSATKRGGGLRPSESVRRAAVTPDDSREGYLV